MKNYIDYKKIYNLYNMSHYKPTTLPTCAQFSAAGKSNLCAMLSSKLGLPLNNICELPEPRAAWTDLVNASTYLEDAIVLPFRALYGIQPDTATNVKNYMIQSLHNAYYKMYYAWMYMCIASGNTPNLQKIIKDLELALSGINKLVAEVQSLPLDLATLNNFAATYIYGFQGVISYLSNSIVNSFSSQL